MMIVTLHVKEHYDQDVVMSINVLYMPIRWYLWDDLRSSYKS